MRFLKILTLVVLIAGITNVNVCGSSVFHKNISESPKTQILISGFENSIPAMIYARHDQTSKKSGDFSGLPKIILISTQKTRISHTINYGTFCVTPNKTNDYSLITLHCLLTV
jgi:hypothetical protein